MTLPRILRARLPAAATRIVVGAGSVAGYAVASLALYPSLGGATTALAMLPVVLVGWLYGMRAGVAVGPVALVAAPLAHALASVPYAESPFSGGYLLGLVVMLAVGAIVGRLHDVGRHLTQSEGRFRELFDYAPVGYHELDRDGRITRVNRTELTMLGYAEDEMLGRLIFDFISEAEVDRARRSYRMRLTGAEPTRSFERTLRRKDGTTVALLIEDRRILGPDGTVLGLRTTLQDNSQQKAAEEKLREADRMKTEFVSLVSHELRTPLTSIKGYVDLIIDGEAGSVPEEQREFLGIVKNNSDRLVALIDDLLDVSSIEAGKFELIRGRVDLGRLIGIATTALRPQMAAKRQRLTVDVPDNLPLAWADAARVAQVLSNLLSNAHKYTPAGGDVAVTARTDGELVRVGVRDSGIGLSHEEQGQLFTKFFRAKNATTRAVGGTGLGLAITKALVELQDGTVSVESAPGEGSTFAFTLPVARGMATAPRVPGPSAIALAA